MSNTPHNEEPAEYELELSAIGWSAKIDEQYEDAMSRSAAGVAMSTALEGRQLLVECKHLLIVNVLVLLLCMLTLLLAMLFLPGGDAHASSKRLSIEGYLAIREREAIQECADAAYAAQSFEMLDDCLERAEGLLRMRDPAGERRSPLLQLPSSVGPSQ